MDTWINDAIIDKAYSLRDTLNALKFKEYNSDAPSQLIDVLLEIVDVVIKYYEKILMLQAEDRELLRISQFLTYLHLFLDEIKSVEITDLPLELLPILEQIMNKYDNNSLIYFKPMKEYNYNYINNIETLCGPAESLFGYERRTQKGIATISFPLSEKNNVLLHCIFSHEIGHHFDDVFLIRDKVIPNIQIDKKSLEEIVEGIRKEWAKTKKEVDGKQVGLDLFVEIGELKAGQVEKYTKILSNWVNELIADTIGACLFGPAYLFSLVELSYSTSSYDSYSESHPPSFIRLKIILKTLEDLGYLKTLSAFDEINKIINKLRDTASAFNEEKTNPELSLLKKSIDPVVPILIEETNKIIKPLLDLVEFEREIKYLIITIKNLIPPNEIIICDEKRSYPANPISILNASWVVRLEYMNQIYELVGATTAEDKYKTRVSMNEHTLKALELAEIHKNLMEGIARASSQSKK